MAPPTILPAIRFWKYVRKEKSCWLWIGRLDCKGYGRFSLTRTKTVLAHRFSYTLHVGPIPNGLCVLHHCDNPPCVNPEHLWTGTQGDNVADRDQKGRTATPGAKLTVIQVKEIREQFRRGLPLHNGLAKQYGVAQATICAIKLGQTWKNVS